MPGKVLAKHGIVERLGDEYRLTVDPSLLSLNQREELVRLCDEMVRAYMEKRGAAVYDHRRAALGYLSGSLRYEILRRAGFRCELCGVSAGERAIEVDHIFPRNSSTGSQRSTRRTRRLCTERSPGPAAPETTRASAATERMWIIPENSDH